MPRLLLLAGLLLLLAEPAIWLVHTWWDPAYASSGGLVALLCVALVARSVASGPAAPTRRDRWAAWGLLGVAAAVRFGGRWLDVSHLGALALVADVAALGLLLAVHRRPWALSPGWLAGTFAFALPMEHVLQRLLSWPMRTLSAASAHGLLSPFMELDRRGTLLLKPGQAVSVDLPCSGAGGLVLLGVLAFAFATRRRLSSSALGWGSLAVLGGAWATNTLRLVALVAGPTEALLAEPAHSLLGLVALGVGALPALAVGNALPPRRPAPGPPAPPLRVPLSVALPVALLLTLVAATPHHPVDVSRPVRAPVLPVMLADWPSEARGLSPQEEAYFGRFGGEVRRRVYADPGDHAVLLVRTSAPLRHLHEPAACLHGAGHQVQRIGIRPDAVPTTVWRSVDPDGRSWRVEASFVSEDGDTAESAAEVAWRWMADPHSTWTLVERITPWEACEREPAACRSFDAALFAALDTPAR